MEKKGGEGKGVRGRRRGEGGGGMRVEKGVNGRTGAPQENPLPHRLKCRSAVQ